MQKAIFSSAVFLFLSVFVQGVDFDQLDSPDYQVRNKAQRDMESWARKKGPSAIQELLSKYKLVKTPEVSLRIKRLIKELVLLQRFGAGPGYVGIRMADDEVNLNGEVKATINIMEVVVGSPAEIAELKIGDHILGVDNIYFGDHRIGNVAPSLLFSNYVQTKTVGESIKVILYRAPKNITVTVKLALMPEQLRKEQELLGLRKEKVSEREKDEYFEQWLKDH